MGPGQFEARLPPPPKQRDATPAPPPAARPSRPAAHAETGPTAALPPSALSLQQQMLLYQQQGQEGDVSPVLPIVGGLALSEHEQQMMYQAWAEAEQQGQLWDEEFLLSPLADHPPPGESAGGGQPPAAD